MIPQRKNNNKMNGQQKRRTAVQELDRDVKNLTNQLKQQTLKRTRVVRQKRANNRSFASNPAASSYVALLDARHQRVPRGPAGAFPGRPSQKLTVQTRKVFQVPTNSQALCMLSPCAGNEADACSAVILIGSPNAWGVALNALPTATALDSITTATPYSCSTLQGNDYQWRCVSAGLKVSCTNPPLQRGGRIYFAHDPAGTIAQQTGAWSSTLVGAQDIVNNIQASITSRMNSFTDRESFEYQLGGMAHQYETYARSNTAYSANSTYWSLSPNGVAGIQKVGGTPFYLGTPIGHLLITNSVATSSLEVVIEMTEHWEFVHDVTLATLHTPTHGNRSIAEGLHQIVHHAHMQHAQQPRKSWCDVLKQVAKTPLVQHIVQDVPAISSVLALL